MTSILKWLLSVPSKKEQLRRRRESERRIAESLLRGRFMTKQQLDDLRKKVAGYRF